MISRRSFGFTLGASSLLAACGQKPARTYQPSFSRASASALPEYTFAVHPLHNPQMLHRLFAPLMTYLGQQAPEATFRLIASRDYASFERRLMAGQFDFALPNPLQVLRALDHGYRVFAKEADDSEFRGIVLVRKDSGIETPEDLIGKTISYPAPTAVAATLMVQYYLQTHGLPIRRTRSIFVGSQESSISSVYLRASAAGGTWPAPWAPFARQNPKVAEALEVKWRTEPLVNNGLVVLKSLPGDIVEKVAHALVTLGGDVAGKAMLADMSIPGFQVADAGAYAPMRDFLSRYEATVGRIDAFA